MKLQENQCNCQLLCQTKKECLFYFQLNSPSKTRPATLTELSIQTNKKWLRSTLSNVSFLP